LENKEIIKLLKLTISLMELHDENQFKIRGYSNAVFHLEKNERALQGLSQQDLETIEGVGKSMAATIYSIVTTGSFPLLDELLQNTPPGVVELLDLKGIGPKKVRALWKELDIMSSDELFKACQEGKIAKVKGFGEKTQDAIMQALEFKAAAAGKMLFAYAEEAVNILIQELSNAFPALRIEVTGELRRKLDIIEHAEILIATDNRDEVISHCNRLNLITLEEDLSGPFSLRGKFVDTGLKLTIRLCKRVDFTNIQFLHSAAKAHLATVIEEDKNLLKVINSKKYKSEEEIYQAVNLPYIEPELREGLLEFAMAKAGNMPELIKHSDLKGIIHNHSTYSDGIHSLEEMALYCKELGYEYLGISDHSKSAFYAKGLHEDKILLQHQEIEKLNTKLAPFKIFKGIESDILNDGSLDYDDEVLSSFDFIVASIHSNLKMDIKKATHRLISAIENPFTTILGHATGRILLKREGYPLDYKAVIDACAVNGVIIEINANPYRLDIDWRWVNYAISKNVMISINPDAHERDGYHDMVYGVYSGRKGGLTKDMTFNALSMPEVESHFASRKERALSIIKNKI
jgi:DNA polymerase (family X)